MEKEQSLATQKPQVLTQAIKDPKYLKEYIGKRKIALTAEASSVKTIQGRDYSVRGKKKPLADKYQTLANQQGISYHIVDRKFETGKICYYKIMGWYGGEVESVTKEGVFFKKAPKQMIEEEITMDIDIIMRRYIVDKMKSRAIADADLDFSPDGKPIFKETAKAKERAMWKYIMDTMVFLDRQTLTKVQRRINEKLLNPEAMYKEDPSEAEEELEERRVVEEAKNTKEFPVDPEQLFIKIRQAKNKEELQQISREMDNLDEDTAEKINACLVAKMNEIEEKSKQEKKKANPVKKEAQKAIKPDYKEMVDRVLEEKKKKSPQKKEPIENLFNQKPNA